MPRYPYWDLKYYYEIHCKKQRANGLNPVSYSTFNHRLKTLNLHDAIHHPRVEYQVRRKPQEPTVNDYQRRVHELAEENVLIVDLDKLVELEKEKPVIYPRKAKQPKTNKPKQNLFLRFISLFKK